MGSRLLLALAGGALIVASSVDAGASPPLTSLCYDIGLACFNAGPASDQTGICVASTCEDLLDASYACGVCELADAGGDDASEDTGTVDTGALDASTPDGDVADAAGTDGSDGAALDGSPTDGAAGEDAQPWGSGSSSGGSSGGGSSSSGGTSTSAAAGGGEDAGDGVAPTMAGCAASPVSRTIPGDLALLAVGLAAMTLARRRRR